MAVHQQECAEVLHIHHLAAWQAQPEQKLRKGGIDDEYVIILHLFFHLRNAHRAYRRVVAEDLFFRVVDMDVEQLITEMAVKQPSQMVGHITAPCGQQSTGNKDFWHDFTEY